ncbi:MAG: hypothetical protein A2Z25_00500 [Planctomycetes bacterium RBG_16_55_9]|nr:MAG: hypothetical protein A2Z25_00500 [Planctomycetes bacterium RBG_16_55_9]
MGENSFDIDDTLLLMRAACHQDKRALVTLYLKYAPHVKSYIASHISSVADTEDLVQEVFLHVFQGKGHYDSNKGVKPYILGIARNMIRRYRLRMETAHRLMPADSMDDLSLNHHIRERLDPGARIGVDHFKRIVRAMETGLPPKARDAVRLRFIEGLSVKEAAKKAGYSVGAFYARLERAIKALREISRVEQ